MKPNNLFFTAPQSTSPTSSAATTTTSGGPVSSSPASSTPKLCVDDYVMSPGVYSLGGQSYPQQTVDQCKAVCRQVSEEEEGGGGGEGVIKKSRAHREIIGHTDVIGQRGHS